MVSKKSLKKTIVVGLAILEFLGASGCATTNLDTKIAELSQSGPCAKPMKDFYYNVDRRKLLERNDLYKMGRHTHQFLMDGNLFSVIYTYKEYFNGSCEIYGPVNVAECNPENNTVRIYDFGNFMRLMGMSVKKDGENDSTAFPCQPLGDPDYKHADTDWKTGECLRAKKLIPDILDNTPCDYLHSR